MAFGNGYQRRYWQQCLGDKVDLGEVFPPEALAPKPTNVSLFPIAAVQKKIEEEKLDAEQEEYVLMCRAGMLRQAGIPEEEITEILKSPPRTVMNQEEAKAWQANVAAEKLRRDPAKPHWESIWDPCPPDEDETS